MEKESERRENEAAENMKKQRESYEKEVERL